MAPIGDSEVDVRGDEMLYDIREQPAALRATLADRLAADGRLRLDVQSSDSCADVSRLMVIGRGSSVHAAMAGRAALEQWAGVPVCVELASGFRHRFPAVPHGTLVVAISQSGETADIIAAARYAQDLGARVLALTDTVGSTLTQDADIVLYTRAGPEAARTATKGFTTQVAGLALLALWLAQERRRLHQRTLLRHLQGLMATPFLVRQTIDTVAPEVRQLADDLAGAPYVMLMGRHVDLPVALEGALKLQEVSSVRADGYAAGNLHHRPITFFQPGSAVVALATARFTRDRVVSAMAEARDRGARVVAIGSEGDVDLKEHADRVLFVPDMEALWSPIVTVVPLQLLGYHLVALGHAGSSSPTSPRRSRSGRRRD